MNDFGMIWFISAEMLKEPVKTHPITQTLGCTLFRRGVINQTDLFEWTTTHIRTKNQFGDKKLLWNFDILCEPIFDGFSSFSYILNHFLLIPTGDSQQTQSKIKSIFIFLVVFLTFAIFEPFPIDSN